MMMNFLDLSTASEEERRLICEILSDTSVINIAEPKQFNSNQQQQQQHQQTLQHHHHHNHQQNQNQCHHHNQNHNQHYQQQQHQPQQQLQHHQSQPQNQLTQSQQQPHPNHQKQKQIIINNIQSKPTVTSTIAGAKTETTTTTTTSTTITTPTINDSPSITTTTTTHPAPTVPVVSQSNVNNNSTINNHSANTLPNNIYVAPQPPGYAIPPHVTAFGPPPHVFHGGPPIFHHHPSSYYLIQYNMTPQPPPQCVPFVMPPNSVVPTQTPHTQPQNNSRQHVPPQLNRPQNASTTTSNSHMHSRYRHNIPHHNNHPQQSQQHQNQQSQQQRQQRQQQHHHHIHNQNQPTTTQTHNQHLQQPQQSQSQSQLVQHQPQQSQTQSPQQTHINNQQSQRQQPLPQKLSPSQQNQFNNNIQQHQQPQLQIDPQQRTQVQLEKPSQQQESSIDVEKTCHEQPKLADKSQQEQPRKEQIKQQLTQNNQQQLQNNEQYKTNSSTNNNTNDQMTASGTTSTIRATNNNSSNLNNINNKNNSNSEQNHTESQLSSQSKTSLSSTPTINVNNQVNSTTTTTNETCWTSASSKSWADLFKRGGPGGENHILNGDAEHNNSSPDNSDVENKVKISNQSSNDTIGQNSTSREQRSQEAAKRALDKMALRFAQKINIINLKHSLPFIKPRGFINKGNGCYINATLQALIACPPFYNLMKEIGDLRGFRRENSCTPILDSFAELFLNFPPLEMKRNKQSSTQDQKLHIDNLQADAIEPKCIYNVLGLIKSECLKGAQEDAEEFLSSVLNGLHEEMIGLGEILQSNQDSANQNGNSTDIEDSNDDIANDDNLWREVGPKNRSLPIRTAKVINTPIQEIFGGSLFSIRIAGKDRCGHRSPFFDLQLDISGDNVKSVQDAIKSFTASETIHDFYCSKTKQKLDAQRRTSLDQLPPILILHLKQFVYKKDDGLKKLIKKIEYPIDLELPDICLHEKNSNDKSLKTSRSYKLLAVVYHDGKEAIKGHYLTDVYHIGSSQWIRCDDSNLKVISSPRSENPDSSRTPYLLFYRRFNTLRAQPNNKRDS